MTGYRRNCENETGEQETPSENADAGDGGWITATGRGVKVPGPHGHATVKVLRRKRDTGAD